MELYLKIISVVAALAAVFDVVMVILITRQQSEKPKQEKNYPFIVDVKLSMDY